MTQNNQFDEVEDFVSFEAISAMNATGMLDESEKTDDHDPKKIKLDTAKATAAKDDEQTQAEQLSSDNENRSSNVSNEESNEESRMFPGVL
ncbi:hypothetical protein [Paenibacillus cremeus]|uniref:Uncharacterized protein n=1 Tax=Paenibacillus cremeus TaxID=2163881 RepID=A0A559K020_9BACL|nr:hypothetical protein [Paenibacillus cremeus]TVY05400.1 hypothetical protein FPZ49_30640 [Paenibacillus cremeus]